MHIEAGNHEKSEQIVFILIKVKYLFRDIKLPRKKIILHSNIALSCYTRIFIVRCLLFIQKQLSD